MTNKPITWTTEERREVVSKRDWCLRKHSTPAFDAPGEDPTEDDLRLAGFIRSTPEAIAEARLSAHRALRGRMAHALGVEGDDPREDVLLRRIRELRALTVQAHDNAQDAWSAVEAEMRARIAAQAERDEAREHIADASAVVDRLWGGERRRCGVTTLADRTRIVIAELEKEPTPRLAEVSLREEEILAERDEAIARAETAEARLAAESAANAAMVMAMDEGSARVGEHPSSEYSATAIAVARADGNLRVDRNGLGWIRNMAPDMPAGSPPEEADVASDVLYALYPALQVALKAPSMGTGEARRVVEQLRRHGFDVTRAAEPEKTEAPNDTALEDIWTCLGGLDDSDVPTVTAMATELLAARRRIRLLESRDGERDWETWHRAQTAYREHVNRIGKLSGGAPECTPYEPKTKESETK